MYDALRDKLFLKKHNFNGILRMNFRWLHCPPRPPPMSRGEKIFLFQFQLCFTYEFEMTPFPPHQCLAEKKNVFDKNKNVVLVREMGGKEFFLKSLKSQ